MKKNVKFEHYGIVKETKRVFPWYGIMLLAGVVTY